MKRLSIQDLPSEISEDILLILAEMANEIPPSKEWNAVFGHLSIIDLQRVMNKKIELQKLEKELNNRLKPDSEFYKEIKNKFHENLAPNGFYGNMGQPETIEEYKNRYGSYPIGYDENGQKV